MKNIVDNKAIKIFFDGLNTAELNYILIRNINGELPDNLLEGKDIDILINYQEKKEFINFLKKNDFYKILHPYRNNTFLYGIKKFEFYKSKSGLLLDINYHLMCRSLNAGEWLPLDKEIQKSAWENRRFIKKSKDFGYWSLSKEDELVTLITRCVFDKKEFNQSYIKAIENLFPGIINNESFIQKMYLIFFKYTPTLLNQLENKEYKNIIINYITFKNY